MGLTTNWLKNQIQNVGVRTEQNAIYINNQAVESVSKFTYLGSGVDANCYCNSQTSRHSQFYYRPAWQCVLPAKVSLSTKLTIYVSLVLSVVLYSSETWTIRKIVNERVQSFHKQSQRHIFWEWNRMTRSPMRNRGDKRANGSTFPHRRSTPLTFWSYLPIIQG